MSTGEAVLVLAAAAPGACCGSFVATAVIRGARGEQALAGRSRCDHCSTPLAFHQSVPIASYLISRGCCSECGGRIDGLHILGEVAGAMIAGSALLASVSAPVAWAARGLLAALGFALLGLGLIDLRTLRLPNGLVILVGTLSTVLAWNSGTLIAGVIAAGVAFALLELVRRGFKAMRSEPGLGFGDVKLLTALAIWLGARTPLALVLACILALAVRVATRSLSGRAAFGPAIACAAWVIGLSPLRQLWL